MVMFARQMGQPRARLYTSSAHDEQKRRCPHGTRAMLLSRGTTKQTSQSSPVMLRPLRYCDMSSLLRFFISRLFRSRHFHPCHLVPRFPFSPFPFSPFQRPHPRIPIIDLPVPRSPQLPNHDFSKAQVWCPIRLP